MSNRGKSHTAIRRLAVLALIATAGCELSAQEGPMVVLKPGQDLQAIVDESPEGTRFLLDPGVYRQQTIIPKDGQRFIGQDRVILSGAIELSSWTKRNEFWHTKDELPLPLRASGACADGRDLCKPREDLFVNDRLYQRVGSLSELGPGKWSYQEGRAYLTDDPTGQTVELGVRSLAFGGDAEGVVLENLVVEKYASDAQRGAIEFYDGRGWSVVNVTARWNHGVGLFFGPEARVRGGSFSHNGQLGMAGTGDGATIEGVEIAYNNYAGYRAGWEAGGTKFHRTRGLVVRGSCVHNNDGPGLWTDIDNIDTVYEGNKVFSNANDGIKHEISYDAVIRDNIVADNGKGHDIWLWGSQILIQNSRNVQVHGNLVEVSDGHGNGISVIHQERGDGKYGPRDGVNNTVHNNTIVHLSTHGLSGVARDTDELSSWHEDGNKFDGNTYIVADGGGEYWHLNDLGLDWYEAVDLGYERRGELVIEQRRPMEPACDR